MSQEVTALTNQAKEFSVTLQSLQKEISKVIVGQDKIIEKLIVALLSRGHVLLEGVPGLAKTLLVQTMSNCINSQFVRLQFTPDLLPADILGTKIYDHASTSFKTIKGPIFSNFILADEINRAPPKVQSALLEAMQENQVSIQGETYQLEKPFFVMATQNPVESEGTYKLPEAQVDRFMFKILISYPTIEQESEIIQRFTEGISYQPAKILSNEKLLEMQDFIPKIYADEKVRTYITQIVDATRFPNKYDLQLSELIEYGASPRASLWLTISAKANAFLQGRGYVIPKDVQDVVNDVLRHRIILTYEAEADEVTTDEIIKKIIDKITIP
ncbi:ATPase [Nitrosopumilus sp. b3]|uniref:AAA family ATPase n=1 Tax=Nitrosopumilus sp. b3 TaxID=2109909 RepID=UPI0015F50823|nr:MoxR family ATPase [Nitrosopumilus sp. b3]KAF6248099.1 ATPase [Nitrosopumilus sp. b3]